MKTLKLTSLQSLSKINLAEQADTWPKFLKEKGHTETSFRILPDDLQFALKMSFTKKYGNANQTTK